jgi:hypothetical protein
MKRKWLHAVIAAVFAFFALAASRTIAIAPSGYSFPFPFTESTR